MQVCLPTPRPRMHCQHLAPCCLRVWAHLETLTIMVQDTDCIFQTPLGGSFCDKHENTPLPVDHLVVWKVVFLVMALLASNPPTSLSPINTVSVQTLCNLPVFQQNLYFVLVCFALCVCMVQRDCCYHIYSKQQGCKLVFVTN